MNLSQGDLVIRGSFKRVRRRGRFIAAAWSARQSIALDRASLNHSWAALNAFSKFSIYTLENQKMKSHLSAVVGACLGLCAGFALCYICLVRPNHEGRTMASALQQNRHQDMATITIARDGSLDLSGERLDVSQLAARLKMGAPQAVAIRVGSKTHYKRVVEVMDACKVAAISRISATVVQ